MAQLTRREVMALLMAAPAAAYALNDDKDGWISLFDGKTLDGWKASEHQGTFKVERRKDSRARRAQPPVLRGSGA